VRTGSANGLPILAGRPRATSWTGTQTADPGLLDAWAEYQRIIRVRLRKYFIPEKPVQELMARIDGQCEQGASCTPTGAKLQVRSHTSLLIRRYVAG
jgi:hypothetical protein